MSVRRVDGMMSRQGVHVLVLKDCRNVSCDGVMPCIRAFTQLRHVDLTNCQMVSQRVLVELARNCADIEVCHSPCRFKYALSPRYSHWYCTVVPR